MSKSDFPTVDYVRQALRYEDGKLFWLVRPLDHFKNEKTWKICNGRWSGKEAGCLADLEWGVRRYVVINYCRIPTSFIVWALHIGEWPPVDMIVDHKDRDTLNDRIENLRLATPIQSNANQKKKSSKKHCDLKGVYKIVGRNGYVGRWKAVITIKGKRIYLGAFDTVEEAHEAYVAAAKEHFGEFANSG